MTEQEKQEIILAVLNGLKVHSMTIDQLTPVLDISENDYVELNGGRKIALSRLAGILLYQIEDRFSTKANLNSQGALMTGEEQRVVIKVIEYTDKPYFVSAAGVYYNDNTKKIETYVDRSVGGVESARKVLSETPSKNVVYCDIDNKTLLRWDGTAMVQVLDVYTKTQSDKISSSKQDKLESGTNIKTINGQSVLGSGNITIQGGGGGGDSYTKEEADAKFAKVSKYDQVITLGRILFGNEEYEVLVDGEGLLWVNGERVVTTDDESQRVFAELIKAVTVKAEEIWLGQNEDVLSVDGVLKLNGVPVSAEVVQSVGDATDKVMSQKAVSDLIGNVEQLLASI